MKNFERKRQTILRASLDSQITESERKRDIQVQEIEMEADDMKNKI